MTWLDLIAAILGLAAGIWLMKPRKHALNPEQPILDPSLPVPIRYGSAEGPTACSRCCIPIRTEERRWVFPSHTISGPDLTDLTEIPDGDKLVVCNACGPLLRGTWHPALLSKPGQLEPIERPDQPEPIEGGGDGRR